MQQASNLKHGEKIIVRVDAEIADLIPGFLENRRKDVETLQHALAQGDYETMRTLGHSMKGAGGSYGFDAITDIGSSLEQAAKEGNSEEIQRLVNELSIYLKRVETVCD